MILRKFSEVLKWKSKLVFKKFDSPNICISMINNNNNLLFNETFIYANDAFRQLHTSTTIRRSFREKLIFTRDTLINNENLTSFSISLEAKDDIDITYAERLIKTDWTNMNNTELLNNFEILSYYACKNNEILYDPKYEEIVQVLTNQCSKLSNNELLLLLNYLNLWNDKNNKQIASHFWNTFSNELFLRKNDWTINDLFVINDNIFKLNRLNYTKFSKFSIKKLSHKPNILSKLQLMQLLFLLNSLPRLKINIYNFEYCLEKFSDNLSLNDLTIFAMLCSKYNNSIKSIDFTEKIIQRLYNEMSVIDDDFLPTILRMLRFSDLRIINSADTLLKLMESQVSSRSPQSLIQILQFQRINLIYNKRLTTEILKRLEPEIKDLKIKDIARLVAALVSLNYDPKTTSIYSTIVDNLLNQITTNSLVYLQIICYLAMLDYYNEEALKVAINLSHFKTKDEIFYAKSYQLFLRYSLKIDCPEYSDSNDEEVKFIKASIPIVKFKNHTDVFRKDVADMCKKVIGSESAVHIDILLPHTLMQFIVICYDEKTREFIPPGEILSKIQGNKIKYRPNDGRKWYALLTNTNAYQIKSTSTFTGELIMQIRQLERIGYIPISIFNSDWKQLDESERQTFISKILCI